jgi:uncharacterized protein with beta-barrel porin domain
MNGDTTVTELVVQSGDTAYLTADYNSIPAGYLGIVWASSPSTSSTGSCKFGGCFATADTITVEEGATIYITNPWGWQPFQSIFNVSGDAVFEIADWGGGQTILMGTNTFLGNIELVAGVGGNTNTLQVGQDWSSAAIVFGENTNIILNDGTLLEMWLGTSTSTMGGAVSGSGALTLHSGTLVINGASTAANPYTGAVTVGAGATLMVGDATHSSAVLGDLSDSTATINVNQSGGSLGVLEGYGTIYGNVNNGGLVKPGGTSGTLGTLTIVGDYTQSSTGQLKVEVSPTGASSLVVEGDATLAGSLVINLDSGAYGNAVYQVLTATSVSGSFSSVTTTGSVSGAIVGVSSSSTGVSLVTEKASSTQVIGHTVTANRTGIYNFTRSLYDVIALGASPVGARQASADGEFTVWAAAFGGIDNIGRDGIGYENKAAGLTIGGEYRTQWHNAVVGLAASYADGWMDVKNEAITASSDTYNLAVYGGADVQNARVDGVLFYNIYDAAAKRDFDTYGIAKSSPKGWAWGGSVQVSRSLFDDLVTPYVRGIFAKVHQNGITEKGSDMYDLAYDAINENTFVGDIGLKVRLLKPAPELKAKLDLTVAIQHDFSDPGEVVTGEFAELSGSSFTYKWDGNSANALLVGVSFADEVMDNVEVYGRLNGTFTVNQRAGELSIGARYKF